MSSKVFQFMVLAGLCISCSQTRGIDFQPAEYVNPFIGASTSTDAAGVYHGLGKTFPGATVPFGMVQLSPNTITGGDNGSGYSYEMKTIEGFAFTQMSGVGWFGELGNFLVMPSVGKLYTIAGKEDGSMKGWRSSYDKATEVAKAGYYSTDLTDYDIKVECTAAPHSGILRFTFPQNEASRISIDLARRVGGTAEYQSIEVVDENTIEGSILCTPETGGWGNGEGKVRYTLHFHGRFSKPLTKYGFWSADIPEGQPRRLDEVTSLDYLQKVGNAAIISGCNAMEGKHIGFFTEFATEHKEQVSLSVAISFVDIEGARKNFDAEVKDKDFDTVRAEAFGHWNKELSKVTVTGGSQEDKTIFYTALYHSMIDPRIYTDVDGRYIGGDAKVHSTEDRFTKRTVFSGWDTFRSLMPLNTIINPQVVSDLVNSLITLAHESGRAYFERWELMNAYSGCMIGNPALSVIADAYAKGIRDFDAHKALQYAVNSSNKFGNHPLGWIANSNCISETLEHSYFDWCVSTLASRLGEEQLATEFFQRGQAYHNIFDSEKQWFRPRHADGTWAKWVDHARTTEWYGCIECNPYQQGWFVPHDIQGMVALMGGREKVLADLDNFFENTPEDLHWNQYYNHANEPVHFVPFLYNHLGEPWKTQKWSRFICAHGYSNSVAGLVGNDDAGQMSAWYVLTASGIHPTCPGIPEMEITSPVFDKVEFKLDEKRAMGDRFTIIAHNNNSTNIYIQKALLNGKPYNSHKITFNDIYAGGVLELFMGDTPSEWGTAQQ